jgi:hypothetical protein
MFQGEEVTRKVNKNVEVPIPVVKAQVEAPSEELGEEVATNEDENPLKWIGNEPLTVEIATPLEDIYIEAKGEEVVPQPVANTDSLSFTQQER